jgi:hypothetical protein
VDRHVEQGDPPVRLDELLPVRPGIHDDLAHDRLAEHTLVEQRSQGSHRLVVAHVVVDAELHPRLVAEPHHLDRLVERERNRLLGEDALHV